MRGMVWMTLSLVACGGAVDGVSPVGVVDGKQDTFVQGGRSDSGDPAVGLVWLDGGGYCSGALVAPDVVLTAGHCVESSVLAFYTGTSAEAGDFVEHPVIDQIAHPSYRPSRRCPNATYDVALLRLDAPVRKLKPLAIAELGPAIGESCVTVGFGRHNVAGGEVVTGEKRRATETVSSVTKTAIAVHRGNGIVDHGDSGGPLLCGKQIVGVTSCSNDPTPTQTHAYYGRVDPLRDWVSATVEGWR